MPVNGYTVGRDVTVTMVTSLGTVSSFSVRTGFSKRQETNDIKVKRADGIVDHLSIPDGWSGTLDYERAGPELDDYIANLETAYYAGTNIASGSIVETITENDGSVSQYTYTGVQMKLSDGGSQTGDNTIKQKLDWVASRRKKTA